jgi:mannose-6-phosphate isomerase-like protein (cupin superfamily)
VRSLRYASQSTKCETLRLGKRFRRLVLLETPEITIIQERIRAGAEITHLHVKSRQFFYVLSGIAHMFHDGAMTELRTRDGLEIPPGVMHLLSNEGDVPLEIIVTSHPPSQGDRIEEHQV